MLLIRGALAVILETVSETTSDLILSRNYYRSLIKGAEPRQKFCTSDATPYRVVHRAPIVRTHLTIYCGCMCMGRLTCSHIKLNPFIRGMLRATILVCRHFLVHPYFDVGTLVSLISICLLYQCLLKKGSTVIHTHSWQFIKSCVMAAYRMLRYDPQN